MSKENNLTDFLTDTANAIRSKKGTTAKINPQDFASEIASIKTTPTLQTKIVSADPRAEKEITPDAGYDGLAAVTVEKISPQIAAQIYTPTTTDQVIPSGRWLRGAQTIKGDANLIPGNIRKDASIFGVVGAFEGNGLEFKEYIELDRGDTITIDIATYLKENENCIVIVPYSDTGYISVTLDTLDGGVVDYPEGANPFIIWWNNNGFVFSESTIKSLRDTKSITIRSGSSSEMMISVVYAGEVSY